MVYLEYYLNIMYLLLKPCALTKALFNPFQDPLSASRMTSDTTIDNKLQPGEAVLWRDQVAHTLQY